MSDINDSQSIVLDRSRQAAPQVFEELRRRIVSLQLPPGTVLSRITLMEQFGISQTPIRDALLRLAEEKLVDIFAQHATMVSTIDIAQARQTHYLRVAVELELVRELALAKDRTFVAPIRQKLDLQKTIAEKGRITELHNHDLSFHRGLSEAAGIPDLWALIRSRSGNLDRLRKLSLPLPERGVADHADILHAIESGDDQSAQHKMRSHLSRTMSLIDDIRAKHPTYFN